MIRRRALQPEQKVDGPCGRHGLIRRHRHAGRRWPEFSLRLRPLREIGFYFASYRAVAIQ